MDKSENLVARLLAVYAIILTLCIAIYAIFQLLEVDLTLATNLLLWSASILAPIAVLMTYTSWRKQKGSEVIAEQAKQLAILTIEIEGINNKILTGFWVKNIDFKKAKNLVDEFYSLRINMLSSFKFLKEATKDQELEKKIQLFEQKTLGFYSHYSGLLKPENITNIYSHIPMLKRELGDIFVDLREELMKYALYEK